ncbi:MAG: filamentous hemagglutinin N-terminal domain-containing protein, partial [Polaromonas sp.]|nr:filamentous hemagglutinin N-terminal domain-containing protein [Polaromonas sp.]
MKNNGSLNRIYRLVWSHVLNGWVAVAESARGTGKGSSRKLIAAALSLSSVLAHAGPQGGAVVSGDGSIAKSGNTTTINQNSQNLSLTWQSFNVGKQEVVNFVQPSATAVAINRIYDTNGSQILGQINANGQVYLINPNGILFGQGAQVNVGALVASTLDLTDDSLSSTTRVFSGNGTGSVINQGTLNAVGSGSGGGYVALLGNTVINQGTITAPQGTVALGAASATTLTFEGSSLIGMQIDQGVLDSLAENNGLIRANGGVVMMSAGARNELLASVVNNTGVLEARTVESHEGSITLLAGMSAGTVQVGGTLDASATSGGNGGFIETSAANVKFAEDAKITTAATSGETGTWLIDPTDFTIDEGGGTRTDSGIGATTLSDALDDTNVHIMTSDAANGSDEGDINVNAAVTWNAHKLTLTAHNDININAVMTANENASLDLQPASKGGSGNVVTGRNLDGSFKGRVDFLEADRTTARSGTGFLTIGENNYTVIGSVAQLQAMDANTHYAVGSNIDNANVAFTSIANFNRTFDGLGHTISNLAITGGVNTGLFGNTTGAMIQNIGLVGGSVTGAAGTGALIGNMNAGTVNNSYSTASVSGDAGTGGLVGSMVGAGGSIHDSYAKGAVKGDAATGGLVGSLANSGDITNSYATGNVNTTFAGAAGVGGLVGSSADSGDINNSYATGNVTSTGAGTAGTGGLVGSSADSGTISDSFATGNVQNTGADGAGFGGLVGSSAASGNISTSYAMGDVTSGGAGTGGLVGSNTSGAIFQSYAVGNVSGGGAGTGGLVGSNTLGTISESFAAGNVTGLGASTGGLVGSNAITGKIHDTYAAGNVNVNGSGAGTGGLVGHNFGSINNSYAAGVVVGNADTVGAFVGSDVPGTVSNSFWKIPDGDAVKMTGTGTSSLISMGLTDDQLKTQANFTGSTTANGNNSLAWDFSNVWTMPPSTASYVYPIFKKLVKQVTVTANSASKIYDGQTYTGAIGGTLSSPLNPAIGTITYGGDWASKVNAGAYSITPELTVSNAHLSPYFVINSTAGTLAIAKAALTVTDTVASGTTYNGTTVANLSGGTLEGVVSGENVTLTQA